MIFLSKLAGPMLIVLVVCVVLCLVPLFVMWLWNALCPELFGLPTIGFWQAFGLTVLCRLLFTANAPSRSQ